MVLTEAVDHFNFSTIIHKLTKPIFNVVDLPAANDAMFLDVPWFQGAFESEGGDDKAVTSTYSRIPKKLVDKNNKTIGNSGVTIGRGFDLGQQSKSVITGLMTRVGLSPSQVSLLAGAAGKSGAAHVKYFDDNKDGLKAIELTREQRYLIYMYSVKARADDAKSRYVQYMQGKDGDSWDKLDEAIKSLMVDLNYRGDLNQANRNKLKDAVSGNDLKSVCKIMSDSKYWMVDHGVPKERFNERKDLVCE